MIKQKFITNFNYYRG